MKNPVQAQLAVVESGSRPGRRDVNLGWVRSGLGQTSKVVGSKEEPSWLRPGSWNIARAPSLSTDVRLACLYNNWLFHIGMTGQATEYPKWSGNLPRTVAGCQEVHQRSSRAVPTKRPLRRCRTRPAGLETVSRDPCIEESHRS